MKKSVNIVKVQNAATTCSPIKNLILLEKIRNWGLSNNTDDFRKKVLIILRIVALKYPSKEEICIQTKITLKNTLVRKHLITEFLQYFCIIF